MSQEKNSENDQNKEAMMSLGAWLGRHQAFGLIANRCSAADAECLKAIRDGGEYKQLGLTWEQFCAKHAGVSRVHADRQIHYLEEFGAFFLSFLSPLLPGALPRSRLLPEPDNPPPCLFREAKQTRWLVVGCAAFSPRCWRRARRGPREPGTALSRAARENAAVEVSAPARIHPPWHFLYFLPLPQGQGSLRPTF